MSMAQVVVLAAGLMGALQDTPPQPCAVPENRQLDFWVGEWDLTFDAGDGQIGTAYNRITHDEFGDCAVVERFRQPGGAADGGDYLGSSLSMYDPQTGQWRQMWVDNGGSSFVLSGGPVQGEDHIFELKTTEPIGVTTKAYMRMIWQDVSDDRLVWRWQRQQSDGSWSDRWVLTYQRKQAD